MKIALVHDDLLQWGGAERVLSAVTEIWPEAPLFTSVADPKIIAEHFPKVDVHQSLMQYLPEVKKFRRGYFPLYPFAFRQMQFAGYDVVLSSTTRFAHTIRPSLSTTHMAYFHATPRYFDAARYLQYESFPGLKKHLMRPIVNPLSNFDRRSVARIDKILTNSKNVAAKIKKTYGLPSEIIYPFVDTNLFRVGNRQSQDYFLVVSRLVAWKRIDIAIAAVRKLGVQLVIVGKGPDKKRLQNLAVGAKVTFLEDLTDACLVPYYRNCKALLMTQEEDFGLSSLEAQACGSPVIAFGRGGAKETVIQDKTGIFFRQQSAEALGHAIKKFEQVDFDPADCRKLAMQFSKAHFKKTVIANMAAIMAKKSYNQHYV